MEKRNYVTPLAKCRCQDLTSYLLAGSDPNFNADDKSLNNGGGGDAFTDGAKPSFGFDEVWESPMNDEQTYR